MRKLCQRLIKEINSKQDCEIEHAYISKLESIGLNTSILPNIPNSKKLIAMLKIIVAQAAKNEFLKEVYEKSKDIDFEDEVVNDLFDGLLNAWIFEEISRLSSKDYEKYEKLINRISGERLWLKWFSKLPKQKTAVFGLIKHITIENGVLGRINNPKFHDKFLMPSFITFNILEELLQGLASRDKSALSSVPLLLNPIIRIKHDKKVPRFYMQNTKGWNDLYIIWNLAFITGLDSFNHIVFKLLFPNLTDYGVIDTSGFFVTERISSLYGALSLTSVNKWDSKCNKDLKKIIREVARESAIKYTKDNYENRPNLYNKFVHNVTKRLNA